MLDNIRGGGETTLFWISRPHYHLWHSRWEAQVTSPPSTAILLFILSPLDRGIGRGKPSSAILVITVLYIDNTSIVLCLFRLSIFLIPCNFYFVHKSRDFVGVLWRLSVGRWLAIPCYISLNLHGIVVTFVFEIRIKTTEEVDYCKETANLLLKEEWNLIILCLVHRSAVQVQNEPYLSEGCKYTDCRTSPSKKISFNDEKRAKIKQMKTHFFIFVCSVEREL